MPSNAVSSHQKQPPAKVAIAPSPTGAADPCEEQAALIVQVTRPRRIRDRKIDLRFAPAIRASGTWMPRAPGGFGFCPDDGPNQVRLPSCPVGLRAIVSGNRDGLRIPEAPQETRHVRVVVRYRGGPR